MGGKFPPPSRGEAQRNLSPYTDVVDSPPITPVYGPMTIDLNDARNWDTPLFPISVAAQAARVEAGTMRIWFERKRVALTEYDQASTKEHPARLLTFRSVLSLAVAADLTRGTGGDVSLALKQAQCWTLHDHREPMDGNYIRADAAGLYPGEGVWTVLIHHGEDFAQIIPIAIGDDAAGVRGLSVDMLFPMRYPVRAAPRLLALNPIHYYARGVCEGFLRPEIAQ